MWCRGKSKCITATDFIIFIFSISRIKSLSKIVTANIPPLTPFCVSNSHSSSHFERHTCVGSFNKTDVSGRRQYLQPEGDFVIAKFDERIVQTGICNPHILDFNGYICNIHIPFSLPVIPHFYFNGKSSFSQVCTITHDIF